MTAHIYELPKVVRDAILAFRNACWTAGPSKANAPSVTEARETLERVVEMEVSGRRIMMEQLTLAVATGKKRPTVAEVRDWVATEAAHYDEYAEDEMKRTGKGKDHDDVMAWRKDAEMMRQVLRFLREA